MKTETQSDDEVRIIALANLRAMTEYVSTVSHRFRIEKVTRSRVHVSYTGPYFDSQGYEGQDVFVVAVFPCYPSPWPGDSENPRVVLDIMRILHEDEKRDYDAGQYFEPLLDCPNLWRALADSTEWKTRRAWEKEKGRVYSYPQKGSMVYDALPTILREYVDRREGTDPLGTGHDWKTSADESLEEMLEGFVHVYMRRSRKG